MRQLTFQCPVTGMLGELGNRLAAQPRQRGMPPVGWRGTLASRLGLAADSDPNLLSASIYRLRRRIERATPALVPLQARSRAGYVFRAPLLRA